jgi:hypothetical protein
MYRSPVYSVIAVRRCVAVSPDKNHGGRQIMAWASHYITKLKVGEVVTFRPRGNSMVGKINSGDLCTVEPIADHETLRVGDIVLCKVGGSEYLHLIKAIQGDRFQIGNNRGKINGWVSANGIFGKCIHVEDLPGIRGLFLMP